MNLHTDILATTMQRSPVIESNLTKVLLIQIMATNVGIPNSTVS